MNYIFGRSTGADRPRFLAYSLSSDDDSDLERAAKFGASAMPNDIRAILDELQRCYEELDGESGVSLAIIPK